jgi:hypothetical protein
MRSSFATDSNEVGEPHQQGFTRVIVATIPASRCVAHVPIRRDSTCAHTSRKEGVLSKMTVVILALFVWNTIALGQSDWRASWKGYIGNYFPIMDSISEPMLQNFWYLQLEPGPHWKSIDTSGSLAQWFPIDSLQDSIGGMCPLEFIRLENDSLTFRTLACHGLAFRFEGRFTMAPQLFVHRENEAVLVGVLLYMRRGKVVLAGKVSFKFEEGGD